MVNLPAISKEQFVEVIHFIKNMEKKFDDLHTAMENLSPGFYVDFYPHVQYVDQIINLLNIIFREPLPKDSLIDYFIFALNFGEDKYAKDGFSCEGKIFDLSTPELLYDAMVEMYFTNREIYCKDL